MGSTSNSSCLAASYINKTILTAQPIQPPGPGLAPSLRRSFGSNSILHAPRSTLYAPRRTRSPFITHFQRNPRHNPSHKNESGGLAVLLSIITQSPSPVTMPAQQQPASHYLPEYSPITLSNQRRSFDVAPAQEVRASAPQYTATVPGYPQYLTQHHQYSSGFNQPQYPQYHHHHAHAHAPPAPMATVQHHSQHQHHQHHHGLSPENWYPPPPLDSSYASATPALESTYHAPHTSHTSPSPLPPHTFHANPTLQGTGYQPPPPTHHQNPLIHLENYHHTLFSSPAGQIPPPLTSTIPVSPTHSNPASISPSVSPPQYSSGVLAEYPASLPPAHAHAHVHAHDDSPRQPILTSTRNSPSSSISTAPHPIPPHPNPATHHRMHHSLTCFTGWPADDDITSSMPTAHQYNLQPQITNVFGILTNGCNRPRHAAHGSAMNLYSPYNAPRLPSTSSPSLDQPRPHVCGICQAAFHRNHDLKRHKDVHNDTKPYVCQCGRAFTRKDALKRHMFLKSCGKDKGHESA